MENQNKLIQKSELSSTELVFLHNPSTETFMSSLHPRGALFEQATDISKAKRSHKNMLTALTEKGIKVITIESFCESMLLNKDKQQVDEFLKFVGKSLHYLCYYSEELTEKQKYLLTEEYKQEVLRSSTPSALANILLTRPKVFLQISPKNTELQTSNVQFSPLGNLVFMRDHMIVTSEGPIIGRMGSKQRKGEAKLIKNMFKFLCIPFHEIPNEQQYELEGGDYLSNDKYEFCGVGLRSSMASVEFVLQNKLFCKEKTVVVVEDKEDRNQQRMHLDTIFNVVDETIVIAHEGILGENPKYKRTIREFVFENDQFVEKDCERNFEKYFKAHGFTVIPATEKEQEEYLINFLNLGKQQGIISVHRGLEEKLRTFGYKGDVKFVEYEGILAMYGAAHCSTQAFREGSVYDAQLMFNYKQDSKKKNSDINAE